MSYLPLKNTETDVTIDLVDNFFFGQIETPPLSSKDIQNETRKDIILRRVMLCINSDWTSTDKDGELAQCYSRRIELHHSCIIWGEQLSYLSNSATCNGDFTDTGRAFKSGQKKKKKKTC